MAGASALRVVGADPALYLLGENAAEDQRSAVEYFDQLAARIEIQQLEGGVCGVAEADSAAQVAVVVLLHVDHAALGTPHRQCVNAHRHGFQFDDELDMAWTIIKDCRSFALREHAGVVEIN